MQLLLLLLLVVLLVAVVFVAQTVAIAAATATATTAAKAAARGGQFLPAYGSSKVVKGCACRVTVDVNHHCHGSTGIVGLKWVLNAAVCARGRISPWRTRVAHEVVAYPDKGKLRVIKVAAKCVATSRRISQHTRHLGTKWRFAWKRYVETRHDRSLCRRAMHGAICIHVKRKAIGRDSRSMTSSGGDGRATPTAHLLPS